MCSRNSWRDSAEKSLCFRSRCGIANYDGRGVLEVGEVYPTARGHGGRSLDAIWVTNTAVDKRTIESGNRGEGRVLKSAAARLILHPDGRDNSWPGVVGFPHLACVVF